MFWEHSSCQTRYSSYSCCLAGLRLNQVALSRDFNKLQVAQKPNDDQAPEKRFPCSLQVRKLFPMLKASHAPKTWFPDSSAPQALVARSALAISLFSGK
jgi:hypothetical protein